ncbi:internal scaffolding protein [Blackfly microvirus SF02]|uniref:Internal scaffolding protein n=1 Tax=Blackfly microvirus SF02 TaxID=2576452 RepID=A0A4P8PPR5_9VIRU|nr:internal scaffolding protein [Blackfly microvirus SF02]
MDPISALIGGAFSAYGASQTNEANYRNMLYQNMFNAQAQQKAQDFNAGQADLGRQFASSQQLQAEDYNSQQAQIQRDYQTQMSNSAYQRATADMKAAGINPMVAYQQGGASAPPGASGSVGATSGPTASVGAASSSGLPRVENAMGNAVSTALEVSKLVPTLKLMDQQVENAKFTGDNIQANTSKALADTTASEKLAAKLQSETALADEQTANAKRAQSDVSVLGSHVNPAYWAGGMSGLWDKAKAIWNFGGEDPTGGKGASSAKSLLELYQGAE